jgi:hypothetical protein
MKNYNWNIINSIRPAAALDFYLIKSLIIPTRNRFDQFRGVTIAKILKKMRVWHMKIWIEWLKRVILRLRKYKDLIHQLIIARLLIVSKIDSVSVGL